MTADSDGFLGRWARRKALARSGAELPPEPERAQPVASSPADARPVALPSADGATLPAVQEPAAAAPTVEPERPAPTLAEAQQLTPASDFRPFVARAVAPEVRNTAFRKLFADPHFNLMDGLDIYIDDYSRPDPLPLAVARELLAAQFPQERAGKTPQSATMPVSETQAAAADAAEARPDPAAALAPDDAGTDPSGRAGAASTDDDQRDHLLLLPDPEK